MAITGVTKHSAAMTVPPGKPEEKTFRYGLGFPFQLAPRQAGIFVNVEVTGTNAYGFLNGNDVVIFDDLSNISAGRFIPVTRNEYIGKDTLLLKSPMIGGFVPLAAGFKNGDPHPHAGSGFGIAQAHRFPLFPTGDFSWVDPGRRDLLEIFQLSWDGRQFKALHSGTFTQISDDPLRIGDSSWYVISHGMTNAVPDGADLLLPVLAARTDSNATAVGITRWQQLGGLWSPVAFDLVADAGSPEPGPNLVEKCVWWEPSLVRDAAGNLLFCARGQDDGQTPDRLALGNLVRIWLSADHGKSWQILLTVPAIKNQAPVTVNCAADGTPYIVSNPFIPGFTPTPKTGRGRDTLRLWPLNATRTGLENPILVRDAIAEFGPPPPSSNPERPETWMLDHPTAATVQLADGRWHNLLAYRVKHSPLWAAAATVPSVRTGCYIEEVLSTAPALPAWNFVER
jgi:hypothetical protein